MNPEINVEIKNSPNAIVTVTVTVREAVQRAVDESNIEGAASATVHIPSQERTFRVESDDDPNLYEKNADGSIKVDASGSKVEASLPDDAVVTVSGSAKGAQGFFKRA